MKTAILFSLIFLSLAIMPAYAASGISLETEHTDYYFTTGEEASVPVFTNNTYGYNVPGVISYTTTEKIQSQGFSYSSSSTNSESFTLPQGSSSFSIGAGSSDSQKTIEVALSFKYTDSGSYTVSLPSFYIHFISESEQNNPQASGSSQTSTESQTASSASSSQSSTQQQIIQSMISQAGLPSSNQNQMSSQQALQNNQMSQDSSALKKQLEEKSAETEKKREFLSGIIENDTLYKSVNTSIISQGFSSSELSVLPSSDKTGAFSKYYYDSNAGNITAEGFVDNGNVSYIKQTTTLQVSLPENMLENKSYQKMSDLLSSDNFNSLLTTINTTRDFTTLEIEYENDEGKNAVLNAVFDKNSNLRSLELTMDKDDGPFPGIILLIIVLASGAIIAFVLYKKYFRRFLNKKPEVMPLSKLPDENIDPLAEAEKMLSAAVKYFEEEDYINAYSRAGQALRLYLTYKYADKTEKTNEEISKILPDTCLDRGLINKILMHCSDVEFAKGEYESDSFYGMIDEIKRIIFK